MLTYPLAVVVLPGVAWIGPESVLLGLRWLSPLLFGKEGMELGDVKLMIGLGGMTGVAGAILTLFVSFVAGVLVGLILKLRRRLDASGRLPFGSYLAHGGVTAYLFRFDVWVTYLSLVGWRDTP